MPGIPTLFDPLQYLWCSVPAFINSCAHELHLQKRYKVIKREELERFSVFVLQRQSSYFQQSVRNGQLLNCSSGCYSMAVEGSCPVGLAEGLLVGGGINTVKNNCKLNAFLWPNLMFPAAFAQKIVLPFTCLICLFFKSVSESSFLRCSHKREFCGWNRVKWKHWYPRNFFFFFFLSA